jgi:hypothetical protein
MEQGSQGPIGPNHHHQAPSTGLGGADIPCGFTCGTTDNLGEAAVENLASVHDVLATMFHHLGIQHDAFSFKFQRLNAHLSGVEATWGIRGILA